MFLKHIVVLFLQNFAGMHIVTNAEIPPSPVRIPATKRAMSRFMLKQMIDKDPFLFI